MLFNKMQGRHELFMRSMTLFDNVRRKPSFENTVFGLVITSSNDRRVAADCAAVQFVWDIAE